MKMRVTFEDLPYEVFKQFFLEFIKDQENTWKNSTGTRYGYTNNIKRTFVVGNVEIKDAIDMSVEYFPSQTFDHVGGEFVPKTVSLQIEYDTLGKK